MILSCDASANFIYITTTVTSIIANDSSVEAHIFRSVENVNLDTVIGWKTGGKKYSFLDRYDEEA